METLVWVLAAAMASPAAGDTKVDPASIESGLYLYTAHCAVCHGKSGRGDGPLADQLRTVPADLTRLAARFGGRLPPEDVARVIDGRRPLKGHGGLDMPVWGDAFRERSEGYSEEKARERIRKLVGYLETIQVK
jgi:mono/diheme cytochrome c family protein